MAKPTLIFFTPGERYKDIVPRDEWYTHIHKIYDWISYYFKLVVISKDCDLPELVQKHKPDVLLFDGLEDDMASVRFTVYNSDEHREIPRAGLLRSNLHSLSHDANFEVFERYHVSKIFALEDMTCGLCAPHLRDKLIYVPSFFDAQAFRDTGLTRRIPIVFLGSFDYGFGVSPWAPQVYSKIFRKLPCLHIQRSKETNAQSGYVWQQTDEEYRMTIASSVFGIYSCSQLNRSAEDLLHIAGSGTVVVTENSELVKAVGFRHMENCLHSEAEDIEHDIQKVFCNLSLLEDIRSKGRTLAHKHHTFMHRPQLLEWYRLEKNRQSTQRIVQPSVLKPLECVSVNSAVETIQVKNDPLDLELQKIDNLIAAEEYERAERRCNEYLEVKPWMSSMVIRRAFIQLLQLRAHDTIQTLNKPISTRLNLGATKPDPVQWALLLVSDFCMKDFQTLRDYLVLFEDMRRLELDVVRWTFSTVLEDHQYAARYREHILNPGVQTPTMHTFGTLRVETILSVLCFILERYQMGQVTDYIWMKAKEQGIIGTTELKKQFHIRSVAS